VTISVRQQALVAYGFDSGETPTLASAPVAGNLLVAFNAERSGATSTTINGTGWNLAEANYYLPGDGTYRKSLVIWWKIAGASEPSSVTTTANQLGAGVTGLVEFESNASDFASLTLGDAVSLGSSTPASSYASGNSASVASTNKFLVGVNTTKVGPATDVPYTDWAGGAQVLTNITSADGGSTQVDAAVGAAHSTVTGVNNVTAAKPSGTDAERAGITALLVFDLGGGGATNYDGTATRSETVTITSAGQVGKRVGAARAETVAITSGGVVGKVAGAAVAATVAITASGVVGTSTGGQVAETVAVEAAGQVGKSSGAQVSATVAIEAEGTVQAGSSSGAVVGSTVALEASGHVGRSSGSTRSTVVAIEAQGVRGAVGAAAVAPVVAITADGTVEAAAGSSSAALPVTVGITAAGAVARSSMAAITAAVGMLAEGQVGRVDGASLSVGVTIAAAGSVNYEEPPIDPDRVTYVAPVPRTVFVPPHPRGA
jgi:hypothetical protein